MNEISLCFVDSNIWLYALIKSRYPQKTEIAKTIIKTKKIIISSQIINEISVNLIRKADFGESRIRDLILSFYKNYVVTDIDDDILITASQLREKHSFSFWDSIVVASALSSYATTLYSEDMQDGIIIDNRLKIVNPLKKPDS